ncbi:MAG: hypothetical protein U0R28_10655 [Candidatus Nanopelagicales bacterium]
MDRIGTSGVPLLGQLRAELVDGMAELAVGDADITDDLGTGSSQVFGDGTYTAGW